VDKPLHVRVAEKLGCKLGEIWAPHPKYPGKIKGEVIALNCECTHYDHAVGWPLEKCDDCSDFDRSVKRYDLDWSATGPIIERLGIGVAPNPHGVCLTSIDGSTGPFHAYLPSDGWDNIHECWNQEMLGATPLLAVCALLLALPDEAVRTSAG
jgi:hypothetical protein